MHFNIPGWLRKNVIFLYLIRKIFTFLCIFELNNSQHGSLNFCLYLFKIPSAKYEQSLWIYFADSGKNYLEIYTPFSTDYFLCQARQVVVVHLLQKGLQGILKYQERILSFSRIAPGRTLVWCFRAQNISTMSDSILLWTDNEHNQLSLGIEVIFCYLK